MRKIIGFIIAFIGFTIVFTACSKDSYADKLDKEEKAIKRFISNKNISVIHTYPSNRVFKENEYFRDPDTGVYIHVIDSGTDEKITRGKTVNIRYYDASFMMSEPDSVYTNDMPNRDEFAPLDIIFGNSNSYINSNYSSTARKDAYEYMFLSPGCARPLDFNLGNNAEVSLIVPFINGSYYQQYTLYEPIFFKRLKYRLTD